MKTRLIVRHAGDPDSLRERMRTLDLLIPGISRPEVIGRRANVGFYRVEVERVRTLRRNVGGLLLRAFRRLRLDATIDRPVKSVGVQLNAMLTSPPSPASAGSGAGVEIAVLDPNPIVDDAVFAAGLKTFVLDKTDTWVEQVTTTRSSSDHGTHVASVAALAAPASPIRGYSCNFIWDMMKAIDHVRSSPSVRVIVSACVLGPKPDVGGQEQLPEDFAAARSAGIVCFAAAGNSGRTIEEPAIYPAVLAVGGFLDGPAKLGIASADDRVSPNSCVGPLFSSKPDFLLRYNGYDYVLSGGVGRGEGTSLAVARAGALAATFISKRGVSVSPKDVADHFVSSAIKLKSTRNPSREADSNEQGAGAIDEPAFLNSI